LRDARSSGQYARHYVALATAAVKRAEHGVWDARIGRARDPKKRAVNGRDATDAVTRFRTIATTPSYAQALLAIEPVTGRTHQIRVHASHAGEPLLGDRDYGGPRTLVLASGKVLTFGRIALHCARVAVAGLDIQAPIPDDLRAWWLALGGDDGAWSLSLG
jgi:23S rRNA-/tRNA-specific pseudouridylate synthase